MDLFGLGPVALYLALGITVGIVSSLFAIGGGIILVVFLPMLAGFSAFQASATSLLTVFLVSAVNTYFFAKSKTIRWNVGLTMGIPSSLAALVSGAVALWAGEKAVELVVLVVLIFVMVTSFVKRNSLRGVTVPRVLSQGQRVLLAGTGTFIGFVAAFSGLGGGAMTAPFLSTFKLVKENELVPTANLTTCLTTFMGVLGYLLLQKAGGQLIDYRMALGVFSVATLTSHFLRPHQHRIPGSFKITVVCVLLLFIISQQIWQMLA